MKRLILLLLAVPFILGACTDNTVAPTVTLGETSIDEFLENPGYLSWYTPGYEAYPQSADQAVFDAAVDQISARLSVEEAEYRAILVVKPNCSCQHTQREMPRVMKTLDAAGLPHSQVEVWLTDTRLAGIDEIKDAYGIDIAPTFLITRDGVEVGRIEIEDEATDGASISTELAAAFSR